MTATDQGRRLSLDAMRGLAALAVVMFHTGWLSGLSLFPAGYLAVDFFFALSGYVIAGAYQARLSGGLTIARFAELRLVRLYPLFALGIGLGITKSVVQLALVHDQSFGGKKLAATAIFNLMMLPAPYTSAALFPLNPPAWSLFMEIAVNLLYACGLYRLRKRGLLPLVVLFGGCLVVVVFHNAGVNGGVDWTDLGSGATRTAFSFSVGLLISEWTREARRWRGWLACLPPLMLMAILATPLARMADGVTDLVSILVAVPLLVWTGSILEPPPSLRRAAAFLGDISYPLYAVHFPLLIGAWVILRHHMDPAVFAIGFAAILIPTAWLLAKYVDKPLSERLKQLLRSRRSPWPQSR